MKRIAILLAAILWLPLNRLKADEPPATDRAVDQLMRFSGNIHQFNDIFPQEKVYLEFDNSAYFQGETIWFKAFVTHATTLKRAPSKVLYVDLLSPGGIIVKQLKLKVVAGQCDGAFSLMDASTSQARGKRGVLSYPSGFYEIRAYTQNMLDFSPAAMFSRVFPVYAQPKKFGDYDNSTVIEEKNPETQPQRDDSDEKTRSINVQFFTEGGTPVEGLPCNMAFKATGNDGSGLEGQVQFRNRPERYGTVHDGMGSFPYTPGIDASSVTFTDNLGNERRFSLPKSAKSGYSMIVQSNSDSLLQAIVYHTADRTEYELAVSVSCRGELIHFEKAMVTDSIRLNIRTQDWPIGVCRITLYNRKGEILTSRSLFHGNSRYKAPTITLTTDSLTRQAFGREVLGLRLTDRDGNPIRDRFCLTVRDATDYGTGLEENLQTNLLLSSDLKGYIRNPDWYLESDDSLHRRALDLLTLVQGWERYEWKYITGQTDFRERHRMEDSLTLNGWVLSYAKRTPVSNVDVLASVVPSEKARFEQFEYRTDTTGYFGFNLSDFYGTATMTVNLMTYRRSGKAKFEKSTRLKLERSESPQPRIIEMQEKDLNEHNWKRYDPKAMNETRDDGLPTVINEDLGIVLDDVDINAERQYVDYDTFTAWDAAQDAEMELDMGEYTTDIRGYFLEKGIKFDIYPPIFYVHNREKVMDKKPFDDPWSIDMIDVKSILVYDDGMYRKHINQLAPLLDEYHRKHIDMDYFIELEQDFRKYRLVDIQVKEDWELESYKDIRNLSKRTTTVTGFSEPVEYYSPQYPEGPAYGDVDVRRTIYWNPNVRTDADGNAKVTFYNNSYSSRYIIKGAGITASGTPYVLDEEW